MKLRRQGNGIGTQTTPEPGKLAYEAARAAVLTSLGGNESHPAPRALRMPEPTRGAFLNLIGGGVPHCYRNPRGVDWTLSRAGFSYFLKGKFVKTPEQIKAAEKQQDLCDRFNKKYQQGTPVEYWTGDKATGEPAGRARIVQPAFMQGESTALVMLEGIPGALKLSDYTFKETKPATTTK